MFAVPELELDALSLKTDADKMTGGNSKSFYPPSWPISAISLSVSRHQNTMNMKSPVTSLKLCLFKSDKTGF